MSPPVLISSICHKIGLLKLSCPAKRLLHTSFQCGRKREDCRLPSEVLRKLVGLLGEKNVSTSEAMRLTYGKDEGFHSPHPADAVVFVHSTDQVSEVAKLCYHHNIPMVPHGTGTGLEQGIGAVKGGVCVDLSQMKSVLEVNKEDFDATVEPGVTWRELNQYIRDTGLMFPVDPGADASLGGMTSTSASGTNAVRYGTMKSNVLNIEVVMSDGTVFNTAGLARRARKSAAGYNLTSLFVGSEGTLGFFTKITLKLHAIPESIVSAVCCFQTEKDAVDSVITVLQCNIPVARIEFVDDVSVEVANKFAHLNYPVSPSLFLEFHGSEEEAVAQAKAVEEIVAMHGGSNFMWANGMEPRNKLWKARHQIYHAVLAEKPGYKCLVTDVCVPISKLSDAIVEAKKDIVESGLFGTVIGHVGDGNFHTQILYNPDDEQEIGVAKDVALKVTRFALSLGGTCTGEHGVGLGKMELLHEEFGSEGIQVMQAIKKALDPKLLMNPGKIFSMDNFRWKTM